MLKPGEAETPVSVRGELRIRRGTAADAAEVAELQLRELGRGLVLERVEGLLKDFPSFMLEEDDRLLGYIYSVELVPDILQVANLLIAQRLQRNGLGKLILSELERSASTDYASILAVNSSLYQARSDETDVLAFYAAAGYECVHETPSSRVFAKSVRPA
jgi:hypothetical protein